MHAGVLTTAQLRTAWAPACKPRSARFTFSSGTPVTVDERIIEALQGMDDVLRRWKYSPRKGETGGYNCRRITGGTGYSLHAYGIAVDLNSRSNPYGPRLITDMPRAMVEEILALRTKSGAAVWRWGGNYRTNKDAMHYEIVCGPADLSSGLTTGRSPAGQEDDVLRIIKTTSTGGAVAPGVFLETNLTWVRWIPDPATWESARKYAVEGKDVPVVIPRAQFDTLIKVGDRGWPA